MTTAPKVSWITHSIAVALLASTLTGVPLVASEQDKATAQGTADVSASSTGQTTAAADVAASPCMIVKHKGTVGRRLIFTALTGVPIAPGAKYDLVDSVNYHANKVAFKGKELEKMQKDGVRVIILEKKYAPEDVESARRSCNESKAQGQKQ